MKKVRIAFRDGTLFLVTGLLILIAGCGSPVGLKATPTASQVIQLNDCQLTTPGAEFSISAHCGKIAVYEDPIRKSGRKIDLAVAVVPAVSKNPLPDPLFMLAGGPGQSAIESFSPIISLFDRLHQKRDIVLVDQRGAGGSNPLRCPQVKNQNAAAGAEITPGQSAELLTACLSQLGGDTRLYTTTEAVEDLEQVRLALGYADLNLLGVSYGTRVALAYQRQYPLHTRTVTLDSVNPLDWELGPQNSANAQRALDLIFARCAADAACQNAFPTLQNDFSTLMTDLEKQPKKVSFPDPTTGKTITVNFSRNTFATTIQIMSYTPETVALIPLLIHTAVERSDFSLLAAQYQILMNGLDQSIDDGMYLSVLCTEDVPFFPTTPSTSLSYLPDRIQELATLCSVWPHVAASSEFKQPVRSGVPTLLLSGEADPITPPSNAAQVQKGLMNAVSLVLPGFGHNVFYQGCIPRVVTGFIESGTVNGLKTDCVQAIQPAPFLVDFTGPMP